MRAATPSFKSELAAYRAWLVNQPAAPEERELYLDILDRWADHAAVETTWAALANSIPPADMIPAADFISLVIERRGLAERLKVVVEEAHAVEARANSKAMRDIRSKRPGEAALKLALLDSFQGQSDRLLGRKKKDAPRKIFIVGWTELFRRLSGQPLDEAVRVLTEVAFGGDVPINAVRDARKPTAGR